ncbi:hypothetical protein X777_16423 [Ooceraea biroi]|uniref:Uncharacterized protein n=1 Tax=Ooceraea biroi TaxID=2015173 RepID=A0A026VUC8_OOCBI|nr:hypothetical protein X777_16423 [Ooceraea biroi]
MLHETDEQQNNVDEIHQGIYTNNAILTISLFSRNIETEKSSCRRILRLFPQEAKTDANIFI